MNKIVYSFICGASTVIFIFVGGTLLFGDFDRKFPVAFDVEFVVDGETEARIRVDTRWDFPDNKPRIYEMELINSAWKITPIYKNN